MDAIAGREGLGDLFHVPVSSLAMTPIPQLPLWVSYAQALAVPIMAVAVGLFGAGIAFWQARTANEKFRNDEFYRQFDRRFRVYEATREFFAAVFRDGINDDTLRSYGLVTLESQFLFDDEMFAYLRDVRQRVTTWHFAKTQMEQASGDELAEFKRIRAENMEWIVAQGDERSGFAQRFSSFLRLAHGPSN